MFLYPSTLLYKRVCPTVRRSVSGPSRVFVADGINSVGDYNSSPGGCRRRVCVRVPTFFHVSRWDNF